MRSFRSTSMALAFLLCLPALAPAADDPPIPPQLAQLLETVKQRFTLLLPKGYDEKLNLTDDQKKEVAKLQKELDGKVQKAFLQAMLEYPAAKDALDKVRTDGDFDLLGDVALSYGSQILDALRMRRVMERRLLTVLTDDQKKVYEQLRKEDRQERRRERRGRP